MPPLTRDLFVSNALWMAIGFSTQGANLGEPLYRGNFHRGDANCNNGQGDHFLARWDETGAVLFALEPYERKHGPPFPPPPEAVRPLVEATLAASYFSPTGGLWVCGDVSSPPWRPPEVHLGSLGALMDAFVGPSLLETYGPTSHLERRLFDALARDELVLSRELGLALMGTQSIRDDVRYGGRPAAESAQRIAESLAHLGFTWPDFEAHLAEAWPASAASDA